MFRSKSEEKIYNLLKEKKIPCEYEKGKIEYEWLENKTYVPDFFLLKNGIILEVKGRFVLEDRKKHLFIQEQKKDLDIRFVFDNPNSKLYKNGKMTYAKWCEKHGFLYCRRKDGIPQEWLNGKRSRKKRKNRNHL